MPCAHGDKFRDSFGCEMCSLEHAHRVIGRSIRRRRKAKEPQRVENEGELRDARVSLSDFAQLWYAAKRAHF